MAIVFTQERLNSAYPQLSLLASPLLEPEREIVGREREKRQLMAAMARPELCNALLLAEAGTGKTALVQATKMADTKRLYLELDLPKMVFEAGSAENMATMLKQFFEQARLYVAQEKQELVIFVDEFHQIVQLSDAAVEAIKPILASSGTMGIRMIAATTYEEFHRHIAPNQPLVERLQRINLNPPDRTTTVSILRGMAQRYEVADQFFDDHIFELIYEYTERYMPASAQPRKSILVLDSMVGWHRFTDRDMDRDLLADVLEDSLGVNVAFAVDGGSIKQQLDARVFSQSAASLAIAKRLQLSVADLNDKSRPEASFLFTGSTGVGKTEMTKQLAKLLFGDDQRHLIRFDMTDYAEDSTMASFRNELTRRVWSLSHSVLLFDEIEKASGKVVRLLLQILDDGQLMDEHQREVSFRNCYIVLTTNAASEIYKDVARFAVDDEGSGEKLKEYEKLIRRSLSSTQEDNRFPPELLGRVDQIVPFQPLSEKTQKSIVKAKMLKLAQDVFRKHGVQVNFDIRVLNYLTDDRGDVESDAGGARAAVARLTNEVTAEIATYLNQHPREYRIRVKALGQMASESKTEVRTNVRIIVEADD